MNRKILQTNKRFSQLKNSQKDCIATVFYNIYHNKMKERRTTRKLPPDQRDIVISSLYGQIQNREIWIPYDEVKKYVFSKTTKVVKSFKKQFPELSEEIEASTL
ncbi:transposase [Pseudalkalibacillus sp. A8]|uniref:transposase n=1 Tax=Pseudalkalibacillus sp. A8 TaxID=3382641 RepID=UPI0038B5DA0B